MDSYIGEVWLRTIIVFCSHQPHPSTQQKLKSPSKECEIPIIIIILLFFSLMHNFRTFLIFWRILTFIPSEAIYENWLVYNRIVMVNFQDCFPILAYQSWALLNWIYKHPAVLDWSITKFTKSDEIIYIST